MSSESSYPTEPNMKKTNRALIALFVLTLLLAIVIDQCDAEPVPAPPKKKKEEERKYKFSRYSWPMFLSIWTGLIGKARDRVKNFRMKVKEKLGRGDAPAKGGKPAAKGAAPKKPAKKG